MEDGVGLRMSSKDKSTVKQFRAGMGKPLAQAEFEELVAANQELQKRNPFGSEPHRKAHEAIRRAVKDFKGIDIGDYND